MPDINSRGAVCGGRGVMFFDDETVIGQDPSTWRVAVRPFAGGAWTPIATHGANQIVARDGRWLAWLSGVGVFGPKGLVSATAGLLGDISGSARGIVANDGSFLLISDFQAGRGVTILTHRGEVIEYADAFPDWRCTAFIDPHHGFWRDWRSGQIVSVGMPAPKLLPGHVSFAHIFELAPGVPWVVYHSETHVVTHPFDSFQGYRLAEPPAYYLTAKQVNGKTIVAWGTNAADEPAESVTLNFAVPRQDLSPVVDSPPPVCATVYFKDEGGSCPTCGHPKPLHQLKERPVDKPWSEFPLLPADVWATVQAEFAPYQTNLWGSSCKEPGNPDCPLGAILNRIAWKHRAQGWGLSRKTGGYHVVSPVGPIASDILMHKAGYLIDVFSSNWEPQRGSVDEHPVDPSRPWVAPVDPGGGVIVDPTDPVKPPVTVKDPRLASVYASTLQLASTLAGLEPKVEIREVIKEIIVERPGDCEHPSYDAMMAMVSDADRQKPGPMGSGMTAHLVWRFLIENYTHEQLVEEAKG